MRAAVMLAVFFAYAAGMIVFVVNDPVLSFQANHSLGRSFDEVREKLGAPAQVWEPTTFKCRPGWSCARCLALEQQHQAGVVWLYKASLAHYLVFDQQGTLQTQIECGS